MPKLFLFLASVLLLWPLQIAAQPSGAAVIAAEVVLKDMDEKIEAHGTLTPRESVMLSATVTEVIQEIHFTDGAQVEQGDLLIRLDDQEEQARLRVKQAQLVERENELARARQLHERNLGSRAEVEDNEARVAETRAEIEEIQVRLQRYHIHAPFSGTVGLRNISPGMLVSPGTELLRLVALDPINLDFTVPEVFLADLTPGLPVTASARSHPEHSFSGVVDALSNEVDANTRSITVRARLDNTEQLLRPGQFMRVNLARGTRQVLAIPESALVPEGNRQFVFVLDAEQTTVSRTRVEIGTRFDGQVEIREGLNAGDKIIVHGVQMLREGAAVDVIGVLDADTSIRALLEARRSQPDAQP